MTWGARQDASIQFNDPIFFTFQTWYHVRCDRRDSWECITRYCTPRFPALPSDHSYSWMISGIRAKCGDETNHSHTSKPGEDSKDTADTVEVRMRHSLLLFTRPTECSMEDKSQWYSTSISTLQYCIRTGE